jgi:virginiamycin B lyase
MSKTAAMIGAMLLVHGWQAPAQGTHFPAKTGVQTPGVQHKMSDLAPAATIRVGGDPDWMAVTDDGVWVAISSLNRVVLLDAATNQTRLQVDVANPCSGLVADFGSLWIPSCGEHKVIRVDAKTGVRVAVVDAGPGDSEGGICSGAGSVWIVGSKESDLVRIDPKLNRVVAHIHLPPGSMNPVFANGSVWVSSNATGMLVRVDPRRNAVVSKTPVGPSPRFLTAGDGAVWVLNQGDGTIARVNTQTGKRTALISAGIPGLGGEIAFGNGAVWATVFGFPITRIDAKTKRVTAQWNGQGGDSIRVGHGSIWLTDLKGGTVWRIPMPASE